MMQVQVRATQILKKHFIHYLTITLLYKFMEFEFQASYNSTVTHHSYPPKLKNKL